MDKLRLRGKLDTRWLGHGVPLHFKRSLLQVPWQMVNLTSVEPFAAERVKAITLGEEVLDRARPCMEAVRCRAVGATEFRRLGSVLPLGNVFELRPASSFPLHGSLPIWQTIKDACSPDRRQIAGIKAEEINTRLAVVGDIGPHIDLRKIDRKSTR